MAEPRVSAMKYDTRSTPPRALRSSRSLFGDAGLPEAEKDAGAVARFIVDSKPKQLSVRDVRRKKIGGIASADRTHRAKDILVDTGWLVETSARDGNTKGRKQQTCDVNPALWSALQ